MCPAGLHLPSKVLSLDMTIMQAWFAVYVMSRHEKRVAQHLQVRQIEHFLPLHEVQRRWKDGSRQTVHFPLFPNYLFVRITRKKRPSVLEVPGVCSIVGGGEESSRVPDSYMQFLSERLAEGKIEPHGDLIRGERVRIKSGPMEGVEGVLERRKGGCRVVVTLELIKRNMAVEFDIADLEPCPSIYRKGASTSICHERDEPTRVARVEV